MCPTGVQVAGVQWRSVARDKVACHTDSSQRQASSEQEQRVLFVDEPGLVVVLRVVLVCGEWREWRVRLDWQQGKGAQGQ